jgi:hypothetical protein
LRQLPHSSLPHLSRGEVSRLSGQQKAILLRAKTPSANNHRWSTGRIFFTPGSFSDTSELPWFDFDLPEGAIVLGDKAYNIYWLEDVLKDVGISLFPIRKKNSKRPLEPWQYGLNACYRQRIETTGSLLERLLPKHIHATSASSFELKVVLFVLAVSISQLVSLLK